MEFLDPIQADNGHLQQSQTSSRASNAMQHLPQHLHGPILAIIIDIDQVQEGIKT